MSKTLQLSILSDNSDRLEAAVNAGDLGGIEGCDITIAGKNQTMGFGSNAEILMLVIGIAGGVPAGVLANAIYDALKGNDPEIPAGVTVMIGEDVAKDLESFEVILKRNLDDHSQSS